MNRIIMTAALVALVALTAPAAAGASTSPQHAAHVTASCLRAHGWSATAHGRTVKAHSPRLRPPNSFPRHPRYQVTFSDAPFPPIEVLQGLNRAETNLTIHCRNGRRR